MGPTSNRAAQRLLPSSPDSALPGGHSKLLARAVELEIIPRLILAHPHGTAGKGETADPREPVSAAELRGFVHQVMHGSDEGVQRCITTLITRGVPLKRIWLDLLGPAARQVGERWTSDQCSFNDVTVAVGRLQQVLRDHGAWQRAPGSVRAPTRARSILLAACPGEQHTFGLSMVAEFFHQAGWDVSTSFLSIDQPPASLVQENWYDVVGLTVGGTANLRRLIKCIGDIRQSSVNSRVPIIAGGPIFALHPELEAELALDAVIMDGSAAPALAEHLIERVRARA